MNPGTATGGAGREEAGMHDGTLANRSGLGEELDVTIDCVRDMLAADVPPPARECIWAEIILGPAVLLCAADRETLGRMLRRLRSLRKGLQERLPDLRAMSLARAVVELDPLAVSFSVAGAWTGVMGSLEDGNVLGVFGECPAAVQVRGVDRDDSERRIAWLFAQLGVPR